MVESHVVERLSNQILQNCAASVSPYHFVQKVIKKISYLLTGTMQMWSQCTKADKPKTCNYRPIFVMNVSCTLIGHLQSNVFLFPFRAGFFCDTQVIEFTRDITVSINSCTQIDRVFLDFCSL